MTVEWEYFENITAIKDLFIAPSGKAFCICVHALASGDVHAHKVPLYFLVISRVKSQQRLTNDESVLNS